MSIKKYSSGAWQDVDSVKKYENGAWKEVNSVKKYESGAWKEIWPDGVTIEVTYNVPDGDTVRANGYISGDTAYINFNHLVIGTSSLTGVEVRVLSKGQSIPFTNFTANMSLSTGQEDETYFRYNSGGTSNTLYAEWDSMDECYYGYIEAVIPAACNVVYVGEEGDDVVLAGKDADFYLRFTSSSVKIKNVVLKKV